MKRAIYLDRPGNRLVFTCRSADQQYWESLWEQTVDASTIQKGDRFVVSQTRSRLPAGARVLDAGCGIGATVFGLHEAGFDAYGVDFARRTVDATRSFFPRLKIQVADVRDMPFEDGFFDGVWSLGVIEHFYEGYAPVIEEARRVLKDDGVLFLTVPTISPLKALKIKLGLYPSLSESDVGTFFQFGFHSRQTIEAVSRMGFEYVSSRGRCGSLGFLEDAPRAARWLLPDPRNRRFLARLLWRGADKLLTPWSYHLKYFVFKKRRAVVRRADAEVAA